MNNVRVTKIVGAVFSDIVGASLEKYLTNIQQWDGDKMVQFSHNFINKLENKKENLED